MVDLGPPHYLTVIPTAGDEASEAVASHGSGPRGGNRITITKGVNRWKVSTGHDHLVITRIAPPQYVCEERSLGDYCYVPSCLIRKDIDVTSVRLSVREMVLRPLF